MTTIAWKDGVLAADKQANAGTVPYKVTKLFRTKTHALAFSGDLGWGLAFVQWFKSNRDEECPLANNDAAVSILVMDLETGECSEWDNPGVPMPIEDKFCAIGDGAEVALGAMSFGASAVEAVECAIQWNNKTGLGVNYASSRAHIRKRRK